MYQPRLLAASNTGSPEDLLIEISDEDRQTHSISEEEFDQSESDFFRDNMSRRPTMSNRNVAPERDQPRVAYIRPEFDQQVSSRVSYVPQMSSKVFDATYQYHCMIELIILLEKQDEMARQLRQYLEAEIRKTLGMPVLPSPESSTMMPFIHCDDAGKSKMSSFCLS